MNNTIPFHSAPNAPQITVDVNILSMLKQAASCLTEMVSENVYLAAIGPDMELTIIVEEGATTILPRFDEGDAQLSVKGAPQIVNASFLNVRSAVLLHTLEDRQIYVSAGRACSSHKRAGSPTLTAIGASKAEMESAVRFSFSEFTTLEQIDYTLDTLREVLPMLRRFTRK